MNILLALAMLPSVLIPGVSVTGHATWYGTGPGRGHAAAGPLLRATFPHWRGMSVRVCTSTHCVRVKVDDYCVCPRSVVIDLSDEDFDTLSWLGKGVLSVRVAR